MATTPVDPPGPPVGTPLEADSGSPEPEGTSELAGLGDSGDSGDDPEVGRVSETFTAKRFPGERAGIPPELLPLLARRKRRSPKVLIGTLLSAALGLAVGLVVLALTGDEEALVAPARLGGLERSASPVLTGKAAELQRVIAERNDDAPALATAYGTPGGRWLLLHAVRRAITISRELTEAQVEGTPTRIGANTCAVARTEGAVLCLRTSANLSVGIMGYGLLPAQVATTLDEAWRAVVSPGDFR